MLDSAHALDLRPVPLDHPDSLHLIGELQAYYRSIYGDGDDTPIDAGEFAPPGGVFLVGYADGVPVASGGWRARDSGEDPELHDGDAEIKRMYASPTVRGRGVARTVLAALEADAAAAGRRRIVLETGELQTAAVALYRSSGYSPMPNFGLYRDHELSLCFAKPLLPFAP